MKHAIGALAALTTLVALGTPALAQEMAGGHEEHAAPNHIALAPEDIEWKPAPPVLPPGAQFALLEGDPTKEGPFTTQLRFPAGYKVMPHTHPVIAHITVISGRVGFGFGETWDEEKIRYLGPGGFYVLAPGLAHFERVEEDAIVQLHAVGPWDVTYVNPADDPRNAPAPSSND